MNTKGPRSIQKRFYVAEGASGFFVFKVRRDGFDHDVCACNEEKDARRIAAALNFHEAHKRGEL